VRVGRPGSASAPFELVLAADRVLRIAADFDAETLKRLLSVVEADEC
jgi:hypothetical protein